MSHSLPPHGLYSLPSSPVHGISQAIILAWVAISFSSESFWPRDQTHISWIGKWILYHWATWETRQSCLVPCLLHTFLNASMRFLAFILNHFSLPIKWQYSALKIYLWVGRLLNNLLWLLLCKSAFFSSLELTSLSWFGVGVGEDVALCLFCLDFIFEDFVLLSRQGDLAAWQRRGKQLL